MSATAAPAKIPPTGSVDGQSFLLRPRQLSLIVLFFFFQAEDGIRDGTVTGVQTCALPIFAAPVACLGSTSLTAADTDAKAKLFAQAYAGQRSEERRVGKECRSRWSPY